MTNYEFSKSINNSFLLIHTHGWCLTLGTLQEKPEAVNGDMCLHVPPWPWAARPCYQELLTSLHLQSLLDNCFKSFQFSMVSIYLKHRLRPSFRRPLGSNCQNEASAAPRSAYSEHFQLQGWEVGPCGGETRKQVKILQKHQHIVKV